MYSSSVSQLAFNSFTTSPNPDPPTRGLSVVLTFNVPVQHGIGYGLSKFMFEYKSPGNIANM